ncbi:hypothetical protein LUZ61_010176 [Rhynchospora tenuis]|uniref:B-block binding subunit of TFIIIC domain-containing protein n=1 Tax=Rhynchospora tenuis TaxID=198213 RepID=A0AAD5ZYL4_9POAL|nr:hypothetical protein LUZ61_010176 [Rhynchospora tenuis]
MKGNDSDDEEALKRRIRKGALAKHRTDPLLLSLVPPANSHLSFTLLSAQTGLTLRRRSLTLQYLGFRSTPLSIFLSRSSSSPLGPCTRMDSLVSAALEEICSHSAAGTVLPELWPSLVQSASAKGLPLGPTVKQALWTRLRALPVLKFELNGSPVDPSDPSIQSVDEADKFKLRVVADDNTRKSYLGIYDLKHCEISKMQMSTLEEVGAARYKGVTQRDLCDKFGKKGNNFHYVVRFLESQRLIMRQSTLVREKKQGEHVDSGDPTSVVSTKSLYLPRYGTRLNLNSQQRIEIVKPNWNGEGDDGNEEVSIEDPRPAMKAICDKLEEAKGKVLVVSDIKLALGYRLHRGHKDWTFIVNKLKAASLVEEFRAKVEGKEVSCLRLVRSFNEDEIQSKLGISNSKGKGKSSEVTDQFVELPLEQRLYDLIESEGSKGITINEIASRLGLRGKKLETPMAILRVRFNMVWESETVDKVKQYRIWTRKNYAMYESASTCRKSEMVPSTEQASLVQSTGLPQTNADNSLAVVVHNLENSELDSGVAEQPVESRGALTLSASRGAERKKDWRYQFPSRNSSAAMREQRILEKLKDERFLLVVELHKWLESLDKKKTSSMDKKTLKRSLKKLQREGKCKLIQVSMPGATNCCRNRVTEVVLQPSADSSSAELLDQVQKRFRKFEVENRRKGIAKTRQNHNSVHTVEMPTTKLLVRPRDENVFILAMRANGFLIAKMIRAKLLHMFIWGFVIGLAGQGDITSGSEERESCHVFDRDKVIKEMPLELFLQVVGSAKKIDNIISKCRLGLKLSELPLKDYKSLLNYNATARLSRIIDMLRRLKLIRLVRGSEPKNDTGETPAAVLYDALELRPYIEEPFLKTIPSTSARSGSQPMIRHDFILSKEAAVDAYWQTLEYCYATANYTNVSHAFPASAVPEVCMKRAWTSLWVMTTEQRTQLLERLKNAGIEKIPFEECVQIARELNLTVEQVLRVSRERRYSCRKLKTKESGETDMISASVATRKRKRSASQFGSVYGLFRRRPVRGQRFSWTDESDRKLIMQYTRKRVVMGARIHRVDWSSLSDLPAPLATCRRRMASLNKQKNIRRVLMRLCNHLSKRYAKYLEMMRIKRKELADKDLEDSFDPGQIDFCWDNFEDSEVKKILDEILEYKKLAKLANLSKEKPVSQGVRKGVPLGTSEKQKINEDADFTCTRDRRKENFERRFGDILNSRGEIVKKTVKKSLAVANAVELLKLVFLSSAASENVQASVAATLQLYSESDIFTALTYLRDKNHMVVGQGNQPFIFSRKFFYSASSSPFPIGTGKRARELSSWLHQQEETLRVEGVSLSSDLQCGETIHLLSLASSGELNITPCVPEEGIGEPDEQEMPSPSVCLMDHSENANNHKRKFDEADLGDGGERSKKLKHVDARFLTRKVKGFPGIRVRVTREVAPLDYHATSVVAEERFDSISATLSCGSKNQHELHASVMTIGESCLDDMKAHFSALSATDISSDMFRSVLSLIHQAGESGVSMEEISDAIGTQGHTAELIVETIEAFGFAIKVNGYDRVQVLDSSFRSKYHINSHTSWKGNTQVLVKSQISNFGASTNPDLVAPTISLGECHKATIIDGQNIQAEGVRECESNGKEENEKKREVESACPSHVSWPILPWLNGDGSVNRTLYEALTRRILGTVMQKPGILEEEIIRAMDVLNPQSCKRLLETLVLEKHLTVRRLYEVPSGPPSILRGLFASSRSTEQSSVCRKHFFANPLSTFLL